MIVTVHFPIPLDRGFDYAVPDSLSGKEAVGKRVIAPIRNWKAMGYVTGIHNPDANPPAPLKQIIRFIDEFPVFDDKGLQLARYISTRYACSLGEALGLLAPAKIPGTITERAAGEASPNFPPPISKTAFQLTKGQQQAVNTILPAINGHKHKTHLLYGVSASGKTEVYIECIREAMSHNLSAIYLVPEISLTPQIEQILKDNFGSLFAIWHSQLTGHARKAIWHNFYTGKLKIALGPRSALFLPVSNIGVIIIDEEHDPSYKADSKPRYHAREAAIELARINNAPVVLGSATPSMESYFMSLENNAGSGAKYELLELEERTQSAGPPQVKAINLKKVPWHKLLSKDMEEAIAGRLRKHEQCLLLINRRGYATFVRCSDCGWVARCPACGVALVTYKPEDKDKSSEFRVQSSENREQETNEKRKKSRRELRCNYCIYSIEMPKDCPQCKKVKLFREGAGTQRIEEAIENTFPQAYMLRWDRDTMKKPGSHARAYQALKNEEVDIVVGTKMIAQGHDFPKVTLAGIIDADTLLGLPDFRASERTFQLISQLAGRAGRANLPGEVIIQTRHPQHYAIETATAQDYKAFARHELEFRRDLDYPPYKRLAQILIYGRSEKIVQQETERLYDELSKLNPARMLGPSPAFHYKKTGAYRWQIIIKCDDACMDKVVRAAKKFILKRGAKILLDVDPEEMR